VTFRALYATLAAALSLSFSLLLSASAAAQAGREVIVATRVLPPMVVQQEDRLSGFSIELWNAIAERLNLTTRFEVAPDVRALLDLVRGGKAQVGVAAISITSAREANFDFSQPILSAGLQIMIRGKADSEVQPLHELLKLLLSPAILVWLGIAALLVIVPAHLVWFFERMHPSGIIPTRAYIPGIFHAMFWAASTLATQGEHMPRHWIARIVALFWMFTGVVFVAFYTAQLAATLTVQQIQGGIGGPDDLKGRRVAATAGSTAAAVLRELRADVVEVSRMDSGYDALLDGSVDAIVFDAPVLMYYAANEGEGRVQLVGTPFRPEDYGIAFANGDPLRKHVNQALLALREDGTYRRIHEKWFKAASAR
jgi:polar amino acid transport system substrate-binding protein